MQKNLVIVESPAKAKTIEKFLGKEYKVMSSYGHIRDLEKKDFGVDLNHDFKPRYIITEDKHELVSQLKEYSDKAESIWLASDEDREGEAIAWHLYEVLDLKKKDTKRIVFHEITKTAILQAIQNPRNIDLNLVDAQQARRVLDRIVGFELSPILWRKVKPSLSAGRVQSVAVRLIVEREREINAFNAEAAYRVVANFILPDGTTVLKAELSKRLKTKEEAQALLEKCKSATFSIDDIIKKPVKKSPAPPFTTSTLQQEAANKLGFTVAQTMSIAQKLYEAGFITYMRTDSVNLSGLALNTAKDAIVENYGEKYYKFRQYHTKAKGAQEAHEAIRPTYISHPTIKGEARERRLYELIWKRTIASQMADAELERTTVHVGMSGIKEKFVATGEVITFDGFLQVYMETTEEGESKQSSGLLPPVNLNEELTLDTMVATERFTQPPFRYTEASLVRRLEELGIGRPSTYAPTIQTVQQRAYVIKSDKSGVERTYNILSYKKGKVKDEEKTETVGADRNKLMPTDIGIVVNDFLMSYFPDIMDYNFTASVEKEFDAIADGEVKWTDTIDNFYKVFHPIVEQVTTTRLEHRLGEREVGIDPVSGKPVFVKIGRYGPVAQLGAATTEGGEEGEKPKFASLLKGQSIETITLEEALKLFELPRTLGEYEGKTVTVAVGRFGPFVRHNNQFVSIPKGEDPMEITLERACELIEQKRLKDLQRHVKNFDEDAEMEILNGRYGMYLCYKKENYKLPKDIADPTTLTYQDCLKIVEEAQKNPKSASRKGAAAKAAAAKTAATATAKEEKKPAKKAAPKAAAKKTTASKTTAKTATSKTTAAKKPAAKKASATKKTK